MCFKEHLGSFPRGAPEPTAVHVAPRRFIGAVPNSATMDDEEVIISLRPPRDVPRHPRDTNVYKLTLIGSRGTGKSALASRLVAHSFDAQAPRTPRAAGTHASCA